MSMKPTDLNVEEHGGHGKQEEEEEGSDVADDHQLADPTHHPAEGQLCGPRQLSVHHMQVLAHVRRHTYTL